MPGGDFFCAQRTQENGPQTQVYDFFLNADTERFPSVLAFEHTQSKFKRDVDTVFVVCVHIRDAHGELSLFDCNFFLCRTSKANS